MLTRRRKNFYVHVKVTHLTWFSPPRTTQIEPDNGNVYVHLALCELQRDCHGVEPQALESRPVTDAVRRHLEKALEVDPQCEFAYETLNTTLNYPYI